jgi:hypothetical protein
MGKKSKEGGAVEDLLNLEKQIKEEKNSSKRDKMVAKLELASKMASRKNGQHTKHFKIFKFKNDLIKIQYLEKQI